MKYLNSKILRLSVLLFAFGSFSLMICFGRTSIADDGATLCIRQLNSDRLESVFDKYRSASQSAQGDLTASDANRSELQSIKRDLCRPFLYIDQQFPRARLYQELRESHRVLNALKVKMPFGASIAKADEFDDETLVIKVRLARHILRMAEMELWEESGTEVE